MSLDAIVTEAIDRQLEAKFKDSDFYMTKEQVLSWYLKGLPASTFDKYVREGKITKYLLGKKPLYKKSDIDKSLIRVGR